MHPCLKVLPPPIAFPPGCVQLWEPVQRYNARLGRPIPGPFSIPSVFRDWWGEVMCFWVTKSCWARRKEKVWRRYSHDLEGAVGCVEELELANASLWDSVDCGTAPASLYQADGLGWRRIKKKGRKLNSAVAAILVIRCMWALDEIMMNNDVWWENANHFLPCILILNSHHMRFVKENNILD